MPKKIAPPISYRVRYCQDPWVTGDDGITRPVYRDMNSRVSYITPQTQGRLADDMETHAELARALAAALRVLDTPETEEDEGVFCSSEDHNWTSEEGEQLEYIHTLVDAILRKDQDSGGNALIRPSFPDRANARAFFYGIDPNRP